MARRPLPSILSTGSAQIARSRELARTAADSATDVLHPLITITRGLRRLASAGRRRWAETPKDRRGPLLFLVASLILVVVLVPYGPLLAVITLMAAAAWQGRDRNPPAPEGPDESQIQRLQVLYEALVPYFSTADDPSPLYAHGGDWETVFPALEFDDSGRVAHLVIRYPAYFPDGEAAPRARIEQLLAAKSGRGREYLFVWDEEGNELTLSALTPLPTDIAAQRFVTAPGETVLGFTDPCGVQRTLPLAYGEDRRDVPPVVWRTGIRSTEPHLLVVGQPGSGTSTLLRSIALQALEQGDVLVIEGGGTGEYACLAGREGVLGVEIGPAGALAALEWAAHETERRLVAANQARQAGEPPPDDTKHPLWILLDRPTAFTHTADTEGHKDPLTLLQAPSGTAARPGSRWSWPSISTPWTPCATPYGSTPARGSRSDPRPGRSWRPSSAHPRTPRPSTRCRPGADTPGSGRGRCTGSRCRRLRTRTTTRRATRTGRRCWNSSRRVPHRPTRISCWHRSSRRGRTPGS